MQLRALFASFALLLAATGLSSGASGKTVQLNQDKIHWEYSEGNFDAVSGLLEAFLKSENSCSRSDSVFLNKHLGVVYAANPNTREKGKFHFFKMLDASPDSDLSDMFVSEDIDALFTKIKLENAARRKSPKVNKSELIAAPWKNMEPSGKTVPDTLKRLSHGSTTKSSPGKTTDPGLKTGKKPSHAFLWALAGTGMVAAAAGTYFYFTGEVREAPPTVYTVDESVTPQ